MEEFIIDFKETKQVAFIFKCPSTFNLAQADIVLKGLQRKGAYIQSGYMAGQNPPALWFICFEHEAEDFKKIAQELVKQVIQQKEYERLKRQLGV